MKIKEQTFQGRCTKRFIIFSIYSTHNMSWKNGVLVRALDSQSRDSGFKTTEWVKVGTAFVPRNHVDLAVKSTRS